MNANNNKNYTAMNRLANSLGLIGKDGHYVTKVGLEVDLTATAETREAILYTIGRLAVAYPPLHKPQ